MNKAEWKAFILALTNIKWTEANKEEVYIDKKYLADCIGIHSDADHLSQDLNEQIGELPAHSLLKFKGEDGKKWKNGCFIIEIIGHSCYLLSSKTTFSTCCVWGNISTGCTRVTR